jgi:alkyl sulfatase BDS1-like metallo-beta-lactamase superfamily hydrolase
LSERKEASTYSRRANKALADSPVLNWEDNEDFESSRRGFIAKLDNPSIYSAEGRLVWDLNAYSFLDDPKAPPTVNPSLWRQSRLNMIHGLFKVTDRIYQVRGYDLSVMSFIETDDGYIIIDPLVSKEPAKASLDLVLEHVGKRPIVAVIYTHSHIDHWGGVKGVVSEKDVKSGRVKIIAPAGFMEAAVSENIMAGNVMTRRATYMYGNLLPKDAKGQVGTGLGQTSSSGTNSLIEPTDIVSETGKSMVIDGVKIVFQMTPGTEAPSEFNFYFPKQRAMCMAENCTHTLHNLYTLRGAQVRDARIWAHYIDETIELFGSKTDVIFASHHWPTWGREKCLRFLERQRDMYKFIHDETLRLANHGYTMLEIAEMLQLPPGLAGAWYNRGYYGSVSHNVKAVYQRYLGWFDGNPANLHPLPPEESGRRYVEFMGGAKSLLAQARKAFERGEYRWVAQVVNHLVFADPDNKEARELQADALEQLGYVAESGPWRNFYLTGAMELRQGVKAIPAPTLSHDVVRSMGLEWFFELMAIRLNGLKAADLSFVMNISFTDIKKKYVIVAKNGVLNYSSGKISKDADVSLALSRNAFDKVMLGESDFQTMVASGDIKLKGSGKKLKEFLGMLDEFGFWFNIVTP